MTHSDAHMSSRHVTLCRLLMAGGERRRAHTQTHIDISSLWANIHGLEQKRIYFLSTLLKLDVVCARKKDPSHPVVLWLLTNAGRISISHRTTLGDDNSAIKNGYGKGDYLEGEFIRK